MPEEFLGPVNADLQARRAQIENVHQRGKLRLLFCQDPEHLPLVMDADRALHRYRAVEKTYRELLEHEPSADVLAEARIVMASTWADQRRCEPAWCDCERLVFEERELRAFDLVGMYT